MCEPINYTIAVGYGKMFCGGHTIEMIKTVTLTVSFDRMINCTHLREQNVNNLIEYASNGNAINAINFSLSYNLDELKQDCGSLDRFETCDKIAVGMADSSYVIYDVNTYMFERLTADDIVKRNLKIQNVIVDNGELTVLGGKNKLIKFRPDTKILFYLSSNEKIEI